MDAFPDLRFDVEELIAEGDTVVSRWTLSGTHRGTFSGIPPTGRAVRVAGMSLDHLADGVIVSGFDAWDALGLRQQLGAVPPDPAETAEAAAGADRDGSPSSGLLETEPA